MKYHTPFEMLAHMTPVFKNIMKGYYEWNKFDNRFNFDDRHKLGLLLGGFLPLMPTGKDIIDTVKPYKSSFYVWRDLLQPIRGVGNTLRGIFNLVVSPLLWLSHIGFAIYSSIEKRSIQVFFNIARRASLIALGGMLDGICSIIRGAGQIATTPLTWFIRMPLRGIITAVTGMPTIAESLSGRAEKAIALLNKEDITQDDAKAMSDEMYAFFQKASPFAKAQLRGQQRGQLNFKEVQEVYVKSQHFYYVDDRSGIYYLSMDEQNKKWKTSKLTFFGLFVDAKKAEKSIVATDGSVAAPSKSV